MVAEANSDEIRYQSNYSDDFPSNRFLKSFKKERMSQSSIRRMAFAVCFACFAPGGLSLVNGQEAGTQVNTQAKPPTATAKPAKPAEVAKPFVHPLFSDHMVIQRNKRVPVWGWTNPGQQLVVQMNGPGLIVTAGPDGKWMAGVGPFSAGGPFELKITPYGAGDKTKAVVFSDVMVGDVWICSGQSNMEWSVKRSNNADEEIAAADHGKLRLFTVPKRIAEEPQELVKGEWKVCSPDSVPGFSAVGYFFGRELQKEIDVPVGLIHTSWGGTVAEAWTSAEGLKNTADFISEVGMFQHMIAKRKLGETTIEREMDEWWKNESGTKGEWFNPEKAETAAWKTMTVPSLWAASDPVLKDFDGVVWMRCDFEVAPELAGKPGKLKLGRIDDIDTTWLNGELVGSTTGHTEARNYAIKKDILKAGTNSVMVRVLDTGGGGGIYNAGDGLAVEVGDQTISLAEEWSYQSTLNIKKAAPLPRLPNGKSPNVVTVLYNGMIAPLLPYGITGAIWYQGESNAGRPTQYQTLLPTLIADWRKGFKAPKFPFLVVQLANFKAVQTEPVEDGWAQLREAQYLTAMNDANVAIASAIDIGEAKDIHPRNKQDVGKRLALAALATHYGQDVEFSGPEFASMSMSKNQIVLNFKHIGGGLMAKDGDTLKGFAIAGEDGKFVWADARIDEDTIVVSSTDIESPRAVRYGWANNPIGNLYNKAGLPATPFRTDLGPLKK